MVDVYLLVYPGMLSSVPCCAISRICEPTRLTAVAFRSSSPDTREKAFNLRSFRENGLEAHLRSARTAFVILSLSARLLVERPVVRHAGETLCDVLDVVILRLRIAEQRSRIFHVWNDHFDVPRATLRNENQKCAGATRR